MHDPKECLNFLIGKAASGEFLSYIRDNKACALKKGFCLGYHTADQFCDEPDDNGPVIGAAPSLNVNDHEFTAAVMELDAKLNGPQPAEGPLTNALLMAAIKRIIEYILENAVD